MKPHPEYSATELTFHAVTAARLQGCTCQPDIRLDDDPNHPNAWHATIMHDDWCPLSPD